ncbi:FixH family protein [Bacillus sp. V3-13]|uniref:FixH family protein n=1 Tax=Bacillus sp. V3-13 TaxID=2053728 RepID=UPI0015E11DDB|nr:FixH family protein [Bacillus sp. V3-13]
MKIRITVMLFAMLLLAGCGTSDEAPGKNGNGDEMPALIEAELKVPEKAETPGEVELSVVVTQDGEAVEDANEVKFEIWRDSDKDSSELIPAEHQGKGKYTATKMFSEEGNYTVQVHVTARSMHTMPKQQIQIGNPAEMSDEPHHQESDQDHSQHDG